MLTDRITNIVKNILKPYINEGCTAVDLTAGNGHDTCFLAELVGTNGFVYSFDVQANAIKNTKDRLKKRGLLDRVKLINDGHENLELYIKDEINIAMFNLGYLPGGDHNNITRAHTTCIAINKVVASLAAGGVISIVSYFGHQGGLQEKESVEKLLSHLDEKNFTVMTMFYPNRKETAPIMHYIFKK